MTTFKPQGPNLALTPALYQPVPSWKAAYSKDMNGIRKLNRTGQYGAEPMAKPYRAIHFIHPHGIRSARAGNDAGTIYYLHSGKFYMDPSGKMHSLINLNLQVPFGDSGIVYSIEPDDRVHVRDNNRNLFYQCEKNADITSERYLGPVGFETGDVDPEYGESLFRSRKVDFIPMNDAFDVQPIVDPMFHLNCKAGTGSECSTLLPAGVKIHAPYFQQVDLASKVMYGRPVKEFPPKINTPFF